MFTWHFSSLLMQVEMLGCHLPLWVCRQKPWELNLWVTASFHCLECVVVFVRLYFCFHAVKLSAQVGCQQTFSPCMCNCPCLSPSTHLCPFLAVFFLCDMHFSCFSFLLLSRFSLLFQVWVCVLVSVSTLILFFCTCARCCLVLQMDRW